MIQQERLGEVCVLRLAHGPANALDLELCRELAAALGALPGSGARALVLSGTGTIFGAGVDLLRVLDGGATYLRRFLPALDDALRRLWTLPIPVVAAVNGHAIAGGAILALACEQRFQVNAKAWFGVPELVVGVPFPPLALEILRAAVAQPHFDELVTLGRYYEPADCLAKGLVHELVAPTELLERAVMRASELARTPRATYALHKRLLRLPQLRVLEHDAGQLAEEVFAVWESPEVLAAIRSYVERKLRK